MKKLILLLFFLFISLIVKSQDIPGEGLVVVDISKDPKIGPKHKIVVIPTLVIFKDGEEVARFQANIMMQLETPKKEVQEAIDEILMEDF
jgi:thioredoxin-like negative regulator of GroEL